MARHYQVISADGHVESPPEAASASPAVLLENPARFFGLDLSVPITETP